MDFLKAAREGDSIAVRKILRANPSCVDAKDAKTGQTALHVAAQLGNLDLLKELLSKGSAYDAQDKQGNVPLHLAVLHGQLGVVQELLGRGYRLACRVRNKDGHTPLHLAAKAGQADTVQALVAAGARPEVKDKEGKTPGELAGSDPAVMAALACAPSASVTLSTLRPPAKEASIASMSSIDSTNSSIASVLSRTAKAAVRTSSRISDTIPAERLTSAPGKRRPERSPSVRSAADTLGPTKKLELLDTKVQTQEEKIHDMEARMADMAEALEAERAAMAEERTTLLATTSAGNSQRQKHFEEQEQRVTLHENNMKEMRLLVDQLKERVQFAVERVSTTPQKEQQGDPGRDALASYQTQLEAMRGQMGQLQAAIATLRASGTPPPPSPAAATATDAEVDALRTQIGKLEQAVAELRTPAAQQCASCSKPTASALSTPASAFGNTGYSSPATSPGPDAPTATPAAAVSMPGTAASPDAVLATPGSTGARNAHRSSQPGTAGAAGTPTGRQVSPVAINMPPGLATKFAAHTSPEPAAGGRPALLSVITPGTNGATPQSDKGTGDAASPEVPPTPQSLMSKLMPELHSQLLHLDTRLRSLERSDTASHHFARSVGTEIGEQRRRSMELDEHRHFTELRMYKVEEDVKKILEQCEAGGITFQRTGSGQLDARRTEQDQELRAREAKLLELRELALREEEARRAAGDALAGVQAAQADAEKRIYALEHTLDKLLQRLPGRLSDDGSEMDGIELEMGASQTQRINQRLRDLEAQVAAARTQQGGCGSCVVS